MKKAILILVIGLFWCSVGFAECIEGNCVDGQGTYIYASGDKYNGEFKESKMHGQGTFITTDGSTYAGEFKDGKLVELKEQPKKTLMKMKMKEMRMEIAPTSFDFICYNECKGRNDESFCRQKCALQ